MDSSKLGSMEQEESHESQEQVSHAKQLPLPFPQRFLLDENTANKQLQESLLARNACVLTLQDFDLLHAPDQTVSEVAIAQNTWIVTRDRRFAFDALKEGQTPHCIALVSQVSTNSSADSTELSAALSRECNQVSTYSESKSIEIIDLRARQPSAYTLPIPPDRLIQLLGLLDNRVRIDTDKLAEQWACSSARARQIACHLSDNGWLSIAKKGRSNRYYPGPSYLRMRNMLLRPPLE